MAGVGITLVSELALGRIDAGQSRAEQANINIFAYATTLSGTSRNENAATYSEIRPLMIFIDISVFMVFIANFRPNQSLSLCTGETNRILTRSQRRM